MPPRAAAPSSPSPPSTHAGNPGLVGGADLSPRDRRRTFAVWLTLCLIWGSTWLVIKVGLRELPPFTFAGVRFVVAAAALFGLAAARRTRGWWPRDRAGWRFLAVTGVLSFTFNYGLIFWGEQHISSGLASVLQATIPLFGLVFAHLLLPAERLNAGKVSGVVLGVLGLAVIFSGRPDPTAGDQPLAGGIAIVTGAACVAYANVLIKRDGRGLDPGTMAAWQMVFGLGPLLAVAWWREGNPLTRTWTPTALGCLLYLALVGSALAFSLVYWLVQRVTVTRTMTIALVTPVVSVLLGWLVLRETLSWRTLAGSAGVLAGVGLMVRRGGAGRAAGTGREGRRSG